MKVNAELRGNASGFDCTVPLKTQLPHSNVAVHAAKQTRTAAIANLAAVGNSGYRLLFMWFLLNVLGLDLME